MTHKKISIRETDAKFDLEIPSDVPEVFVDGFSQFAQGVPTTKILFHSVRGLIDGDISIEDRKAVLLMTISTDQLVEVCRLVLSTISKNKDAFDKGYLELHDRFMSRLSDLHGQHRISERTDGKGQASRKAT